MKAVLERWWHYVPDRTGYHVKDPDRLLIGGKQPVQSLMICGEKKATLQIGVGDDAIIMESALIKHTVDFSPQAQPSADEIQKQIGADDEANQAVENEAVQQDMITK